MVSMIVAGHLVKISVGLVTLFARVFASKASSPYLSAFLVALVPSSHGPLSAFSTSFYEYGHE